MAASLRANPSVQSVDRLHYRSLLGDGVANDPYLNNDDQWYLYKTNVDPGAWKLTHGASGVTVAVIDTGVDETDQDFIFDFKESVVNGVTHHRQRRVQDTNGHGTNTAGLATAQTNNSYGFAGVGWSTQLARVQDFPGRDDLQRPADGGHGR